MSKRFTLSPIVAGLVLAAAAPQAEGQRPQLSQIASPSVAYEGTQPIPFTLFRSTRIFFDGQINGRATPMMLDSGAGMTVVDVKFAEQIGLKATHSATVQDTARGGTQGGVARGVHLSAGGLHLRGVDVLILDLGGIEGSIGRPVPVVLGHEAFAAGVVTVDFPSRQLTFHDRARYTPLEGSKRVPLILENRIPTVQLSINGLPPITADFDLGNGGTILLAKDYWEKQPSLAKLPFARSQAGGVSGVRDARLVTVPQVTFAGEQFENVPLTLNAAEGMLPDTGANIGLEMLKSFVVSIDFTRGMLDLTRTQAQRPLARDRSGVRTSLVGDRLRVVFVSPEGPAAAAGLKQGDEIQAVNGLPVTAAFFRSPQAEWNRAAAGSDVQLQLSDGRSLRFALRDYF